MKIDSYHFDCVGSTNSWAKENAHLFDQSALTVVSADAQTAGRGQWKRKWISPPNENLYCSFLFFVPCEKRRFISRISKVVASSLVTTLEKLDFKPTIKEPNDILLSGKKVAGILCETAEVNGMLCVIVGVGLNINMPLDTAKEIDQPATSLFIEKGHVFDIDSVRKLLLTIFQTDLQHFLR